MNRSLVIAFLGVLEQTGWTTPPRPVAHPWSDAVTAAKAELEACTHQAHAIGDVIVRRKSGQWSATASRSLGAAGPKIAACARRAIERRYVVTEERYIALDDMFAVETLKVGRATAVLPAVATFVPAWRAAIASTATLEDRARFAKLLPPDYAIDKQCVKTDRPFARDVEQAWIEGAFHPVSRFWQDTMSKIVGYATWSTATDGTVLVTRSANGLCLEDFDRARRALDLVGTCWVGSPLDVLVKPRVEFPANHSYTQVSTHNGRTCALTTAGAVECCGRNDATLAAASPPTTKLEKIATGAEFTCGLDAVGTARCWGTIASPPPGAFTKLVAGDDRVCGIRRNGALECWGFTTTIPPGTYIDVAVDMKTCGVHTDGALECWGVPPTIQRPPGRFKAVASSVFTSCGLRRDGTVGCLSGTDGEAAMTVRTPVPDVWTDITSASVGACGLRADRSIACTARTQGVPAGPFRQLTGDGQQMCGVSSAGQITCWGDPWPGREPVAPVMPTGVHGTIVDERGAPISNAEVLICDDIAQPCGAVAFEARTKPGTLAALTKATPASPTWSLSTTHSDGTWSAPTHAFRLDAVITAPGRELVEIGGQSPEQLAVPIMLRPASTVDIVPWCDGHACPPASIAEGHGMTEGTHLERVAPGGYRFEVWSERENKRERVGDVEVEMPFAATPQRAHPALDRTGTGHSIRGRIELDKDRLGRVRVNVTCVGTEHTIRRSVAPDAHGEFEVENVGALPCSIQAMGGTAGEMISTGEVSITAYADRVMLRPSVTTLRDRR